MISLSYTIIMDSYFSAPSVVSVHNDGAPHNPSNRLFLIFQWEEIVMIEPHNKGGNISNNDACFELLKALLGDRS